MSADLAFAEFIDSCLDRYRRTPRAFLDEMTAHRWCPSDHRHGETASCYSHHGCRCTECRDAMKVRRKLNRSYNIRRNRRAAA